METKRSFCRICESMCGIDVDVENGRVSGIRPNTEHVATRGFACVKGLHQQELFDSPDRLRTPEKRVGDRWEPISWEQALSEIGEKVRRLRALHGEQSTGLYVGTAAGFSMLHPVFAQGFMEGLGSDNVFASATQDCSNKFAVAREMYGFPFSQTFPDVENVDCLVIVGANPVVSKWSFLHVANPGRRIREIQARGGEVCVVDPRRTETAKLASRHLFIRPDTDVFFYASFLHELIAIGGVDRTALAQTSHGFDEVEKLVAAWPPERTASVTGIEAEDLRALVRRYSEADGAALYCSTGVNMGTQGSLAFWLQEVINAASGNLERHGGSRFGQGLVDFAKFGKRSGMFMKEARSRIGGFRTVNDAFPGGILADEILTPGEGRLRALFVTGGNPLLTMPNAGRLRDALRSLELLVTVDIYRNETGSLANYVLPATSPLERPDILFAFPLLMGMQSVPYLQATEPVIEPDGEQRDEASIYLELCRASGVSLFGSRIAQRVLEFACRFDRRRRSGKGGVPGLPQQLLLSLLLRVAGAGSFRALLRARNGRPLPRPQGDAIRDGRLVTDDQRVALAPERLMAKARDLERLFDGERSGGPSLRLITKRDHATHNSWTHNVASLQKSAHGRNHLYVHPEDARALGLEEGADADVWTDTACVRVPVKLLPDLMRGTVALPHGWGHQHATGLRIASQAGGVNVNLLAADGPDAIEPLSGMAHLTGFPVEVRPASGPRSDASWSGMPER